MNTLTAFGAGLQHTYGGTWFKVDGDFSNGTVTAKRLDDTMPASGPSLLGNTTMEMRLK